MGSHFVLLECGFIVSMVTIGGAGEEEEGAS